MNNLTRFWIITLCCAAFAQDPHLVVDLVTHTGEQRNGNPRSFVSFAGRTWFTAENGGVVQLWSSDGTPGGTEMVLDIASSAAGEVDLLVLGDHLVLAQYIVNGYYRVWVTDGTPRSKTALGRMDPDALPIWLGHKILFHEHDSGRLMAYDGTNLTELAEIPADEQFWLIQHEDRAWLAVGSDDVITEVWISDGSVAGTARLGRFSSDQIEQPLTLPGGILFPLKLHLFGNQELWFSDGTAAGTSLYRQVRGFTGKPLNGGLVLEYTGDHDEHVVWTNGTSETDLHSAYTVTLVNKIGEKVFFTSALNPVQLWVTDGTLAGTLQLGNVPTIVYEVYEDPFGTVLIRTLDRIYRYNGTALTVLASDLEATERFYTVENQVFFLATTPDHGEEFWVTDGTVEGTHVIDLNPGFEGTDTRQAHATDNKLFFDAIVGDQRSIYATDGTLAGTVVVYDVIDLKYGALDLNGGVFFYGNPLIFSDGTPASTVSLGSFRVLPNPTVIGNQVFFAGGTITSDLEPWVSDGTPGGTQMLREINPATPGSVDVAHAKAAFGQLSFSTADGLYLSDGTDAGTRLVNSQAALDDYHPFRNGFVTRHYNTETERYELLLLHGNDTTEVLLGGLPHLTTYLVWQDQVVYERASHIFLVDDSEATSLNLGEGSQPFLFQDQLYFLGPDRDLWHSDGTSEGTAPLEADADYAVLSFGNGRTQNEDVFYFFGEMAGNEYPFVSDGTAVGTRPLIQRRAVEGADKGYFVRFDGKTFFVWQSQAWCTDGTDEGTYNLSDPHGLSVISMALTETGVLFITRANGNDPMGLWRSRGTPGTTYKLRHFEYISLTINREDVAYFQAYEEGSGHELWRSDGTPGGTRMVADIQPGYAGSYPSNFVEAGARIFFTAYTEQQGSEWWSFCDAPDTRIRTESWLCEGSVDLSAYVPDAGIAATYDWSIQNGVLTANLGHQISFTPNGSEPVMLDVTVSLPDGCFGSGSITLPVLDGVPTATGPISGPTHVCAFSRENAYSTTDLGDGTRYDWTVPAGADIITGQGTPNILVNFGEGVGEISVTASNVCGDSTTSSITVFHQTEPPVADAGVDQDICDAVATLLAANDPVDLTGTWSISAGFGGQLADPSSPTSGFTGLAGESYILRWTLSGGSCGNVYDELRVTFHQATELADAGLDQALCQTWTYLEATPLNLDTGRWTIVSGVGGSLTNSHDSHTRFSGTEGVYILRWTVEGGLCPDSFDEVQISFFDSTTVIEAGNHQVLEIGQGISLNATQPTGLASGSWQILSGPDLSTDQFSDPSDSAAVFTPSTIGTYELEWSLTRGVCSVLRDTLFVYADVAAKIPYRLTSANRGSSNTVVSNYLIGTDGILYFLRYGDLWRSDGTPAGTWQLTDNVEVHAFHPFDGGVVVSLESSSSLGIELYWCNGNPLRFSLIKDIRPGNRSANDSLPEDFFQVGNYLLFTAYTNGAGRELWRTDGTEAGTVMVRDIWSGIGGGNLFGEVSIDGIGYFSADDGTGRELWRSDGTEPGTYLVKDINPTGDSSPASLTVFNHRLYFTTSYSRELWRSDGTEAGTVALTDLPGTTIGPVNLRAAQNQLFFSAPDSTGHRVLHAMDVTETVVDLGVPFDDGAVAGNNLIFKSDAQTYGSDGTVGGTAALEPGGQPLDLPTSLTRGEERAYFIANEQLYASDGTSAGTEEIFSPEFLWYNDAPMFEALGLLFFPALLGDDYHDLHVLELPPTARIYTTENVCSSALQQAHVTTAAPGSTYHWTVNGGRVAGGQGTESITFLAEQSGPLLLEVMVTTVHGAEGYGVVQLQADPMNPELWHDDEAYRDERDDNSDGRIDILDFTAHFTQCADSADNP